MRGVVGSDKHYFGVADKSGPCYGRNIYVGTCGFEHMDFYRCVKALQALSLVGPFSPWPWNNVNRACIFPFTDNSYSVLRNQQPYNNALYRARRSDSI